MSDLNNTIGRELNKIDALERKNRLRQMWESVQESFAAQGIESYTDTRAQQIRKNLQSILKRIRNSEYDQQCLLKEAEEKEMVMRRSVGEYMKNSTSEEEWETRFEKVRMTYGEKRQWEKILQELCVDKQALFARTENRGDRKPSQEKRK